MTVIPESKGVNGLDDGLRLTGPFKARIMGALGEELLKMVLEKVRLQQEQEVISNSSSMARQMVTRFGGNLGPIALESGNKKYSLVKI